VCVPVQVTRKVQVRVCNMVAQEIDVQQCSTGCGNGCNYGGCNTGCGSCCH
jgi:hypothetical protein